MDLAVLALAQWHLIDWFVATVLVAAGIVQAKGDGEKADVEDSLPDAGV